MARRLGVILPRRNGELITEDGNILLSMDVSFGKRDRIMARPSVHLYLGGVVTMEANKIAEKLADSKLMIDITKEVQRKILTLNVG